MRPRPRQCPDKAQTRPRQGPDTARPRPRQGQAQAQATPRQAKQVPNKAQRLGFFVQGLVWVWPRLGPAWALPGICLGLAWTQLEF